ncbi:SpoIIE family protein phosphatase [Streptomyces sp. NPDC047000]|uniref:PP2C family protein-serine/threonine phosphatase n=1 Tax=Streptomyces sp. NPDC047000 TaxID=3155474 RepID=UPI0033E3DA84
MEAAWRDAPCPVLIAGPGGELTGLNARAAALLSGAGDGARLGDVAPAWITRAHRRLVARPGDGPRAAETDRAVHGPVGERMFAAHPTPIADGTVMWWLVDETDRRTAEAALAGQRQHAAFLSLVSGVLLSSLNVERCMDETARLAATHLARAAVVVAPARGPGLPLTFCGADGAPAHRQVRARPEDVPGLADALRGYPPVPSRWIDPAGMPSWIVPEDFPGEVGSVVVTPLPGHGVPAGALILLRPEEQRCFTEDEETLVRQFALRAGAAMSAARMYADQTAITGTLMRELLPPDLHTVHGVEFAGSYRPSGESDRVGGDFYDVHPGADEGQETLAVLGDVCGKGLEAAVLTGKIRNTLQAVLPMADDHQRLLGLLNGALMNSRHTRFVTLVLASVTRRGGTVGLRLTSAGHPAPLILRSDGTVERARTRGSLVGVFEDITSTTAHVELAPGELCLLYTDGVTEARGGPLGGELFGQRRLEEALAQCAGMPAEAVVEHIRMLAEQWAERGRHDDMALLAITAPRHAHLSAVDGRTAGRYTA